MTKRKAKKGAAIWDQAIEGLRQMNTQLRAGRPLSDFYTRRQFSASDFEPRAYRARDVRAVRESLRASQGVFAQVLGTSPQTIQAWEQGRHAPPRMARRLLDEIARDPQHWARMIQGAYRRKGA